MPEVETWQACALALNIDPDSLERPEQELMCPPSDGFLTKSFPSYEDADNFEKLLRLLHANRESQHFTPTHNVHTPVRLCEFAAWCAPVVRGLIGCDIPEELAGLAKLKVSNAPPPITPVGNTPFKPHQFDTNVKGSPNWKHWRHVSTVEIWQGLLLSLNIEPPGNGWLIDNAVGGTGDIPYEYLDSNGLTDEFIRRWKLVRNRLDTLYAAMGSTPNAELTNFLRLPLFAAWAVEFEWEGLPPELVALAQSSEKQTDAPAAGKVGTNKKTWDDAKLRALWEESIMPNVTNTSLAKKHGVTRQRIGALIKVAKARFSTSGKAMSSKYSGLIVHKMALVSG